MLREISHVPGCEDVAAPATYGDLRATACDGPIVYLAATEQGGSAVIVTDAPTPIVVELPTLYSAEVDERTRQLLSACNQQEVADEIARQLPWLWDVLLQPLVQQLPPASLVTLIPLGALSQLPIHAAAAGLSSDGIWTDRTEGLVFRFAPNARVLQRAQAVGNGPHSEDLRVLTVAVPDPGLPCVEAESAAVSDQFSEERTARPWPATVDSVLAALDACAIWHFACHGLHDPVEPLNSHLRLADGPLTLRSMFARPSSRARLAVLSACQTAVADPTVLDEVVNFPSALLQNGVGGVICSQTVVRDDAAMLLVLSFFQCLRRGAVPARALAQAQAWLRRATNEQISTAFPVAYPMPPECTEYWRERRPFSEPYDWAAFSYWGH